MTGEYPNVIGAVAAERPHHLLGFAAAQVDDDRSIIQRIRKPPDHRDSGRRPGRELARLVILADRPQDLTSALVPGV